MTGSGSGRKAKDAKGKKVSQRGKRGGNQTGGSGGRGKTKGRYRNWGFPLVEDLKNLRLWEEGKNLIRPASLISGVLAPSW